MIETPVQAPPMEPPPVTPTALASGLLGLELARKYGNDVELDPLKLPDNERRKRFGARIKLLRQALGIKQADLAAAIGTTPQALSVWEVGRQEPSVKKIIALAKALRTTSDWLLGITP